MGKRKEGRQKVKKTENSGDCDLDRNEILDACSLAPLSPGTLFSRLRRSRYVQVLLAVTLIGAFLRFYNLGFNSLWLDEASTYTLSVGSIPQIWEATAAGEFNPPLFYWLEHIMLGFGNNEITLIFIPALLGVPTIPLVYLAGKEFIDRNVGIIAAAAFAFSLFLIFYSQEARHTR